MSAKPGTVFITGSSGFIGKNICAHLKDEYTLLTPTHKELNLLSQAEVNRFFSSNDIDFVIHCANYGGTRKTPTSGLVLEKNLRMFFNIAENQNNFAKLIYLGSGAEYNKCRNLHNVSEDEIGQSIPLDEYGCSKYIISKYIEKTQKMYCLRLFGIFGRYEDFEFKFVSNAIVKNLLHLPITIQQNVNFSWLYITDFLSVLDYFLTNKPKKRSYNVTPPQTADLISIAELINSCSDYHSDICVENEGLNLEYSGNNALLMSEIPTMTFTPLKTAINDLINYYKTILPMIDPDLIRRDPYAVYCRINPKK